MSIVQQLRTRADRCRMLAHGLNNRDDVRALESLATEYEERARAVERPRGSKQGSGA